MDFNSRLDSLKKRRQGPQLATFDGISEAAYAELNKALKGEVTGVESFESIQEPDGVKYTVGAMAPVEKRYTEISIAEGERVATSLSKSLLAESVNVEYRLQGSVGLDVHIKGYSDVDMLVLIADTLTVQSPYVNPSSYSDAKDMRPLTEIISDLRSRSERILTNNFPKVNINVNGGKSIALEGGSLARKIDIVPAFWYHSRDYQSCLLEHYKGVRIFNKLDLQFITNYPFLNKRLVNDADEQCGGNLKRVVRLMKTLQADATGDVAESIVKLNSFDVLSIAYDMRSQLYTPYYHQLTLVDTLVDRLQYLIVNKEWRQNMETPDCTRKVFNDEGKLSGLVCLHRECQRLAVDLAKEINPLQVAYDRDVLRNKLVF
ncbi:hypothetical protein CCL19_20365 [Pseudomonas syringae]|uniref:hypothetical protein n=1 Tax=Pseudomonas syringae TaxID=317 RepID=UPI000BB62F3E|nr:hypothetical protein [Pseudomonas syringae]PBP62596.1 hypothetical protein CCL19_20365 [Pseudomonas syringae]